MPPTQVITSVSAAAVAAHAACAVLLAATFAYLARLFARPYLRHWAAAWGAQLAALLAVGIFLATGQHGYWLVYLTAEWAFLAALLIGCREMAHGGEIGNVRRFLLPGVFAAVILAGGLVPFFPDFDSLFSMEAGVRAAGFGAAVALLSGLPPARRAVGFHLMRVALAWLTVQCILYVPAYALDAHGRLAGTTFTGRGYASIAALCAQLLLGLGMLFVATAAPRRDAPPS
jgi:hypothetical protein